MKNNYSQEVEESFLANMALDGEIYKLNGKITEDHFYFPEHKKLFNCMKSILEKHESVSPFVLQDRTGISKEIIANIVIEKCGIAFGIQTAYDILEEYRLKRYASDLMRGTLNGLDDLTGDMVAQEIQKCSDGLAEGLLAEHDNISLIDDLKYDLENIDKEDYGFTTGVERYDECLGNLRHGEFHVIAGMPSVGKSAMALNMMLNMAEKGLGVLYFSVEEDKRNFRKRIYANKSGIPFGAFLNGLNAMQKDDCRKWIVKSTSEGGIFHNINMFIDDSVDTMPDIFSRSASYKHRRGLDVVIIDGATSIVTGEKDMLSNYEYIGKQCLKLARQLGVCVILLAHVNSESLKKDKETKKAKPNMTSVYGGQALVKLAFSVTVLTRDMDKERLAGSPIEVDGYVIKARNASPDQKMEFEFDGNRQQYM